jgi:nucleotide-binding universal stress UspA family protein
MSAISERFSRHVRTPRLKQIVVAVDLSSHSEKTVAYAVQIARNFGATIYLAYVHAFPQSLTEYTTQEFQEYLERERHELERELENFCEKIRQTYPNCGAEFRVGDPADEVSQLARTLDADLIIVASRHISLLRRLFDLDPASKLIHHAPCPVLVYHD